MSLLDNSFSPASLHKTVVRDDLWSCRYLLRKCVFVFCVFWKSGTNCTGAQSQLHVLHNGIFPALCFSSVLCQKNIIRLSGVGVWDETTLNDRVSE